MEPEKKEVHIVPPKRVESAAVFALSMLGLFLVVLAISSVKEYRFIGSGVTATNTITVSGDGEVFAVPDTGEFSVTIQEEAKDVATAQAAATKKTNDIVAYLKSAGVAEKDVKTTDYSVYPQYDWTNATCTPGSTYCPPGKQVLRGFQVSQTLSVKVKDTTKAGELLSGVGTKGASQVSGLSFTVEDEDALKAQARDKAISSAKSKADELASQLGVQIVRVVGFNENSGGYPIMYAKTAAMDSMGGARAEAAPAPAIPTGENKISSSVSVTYEIR
jgi:uncharacterized protein YggE